MIKKCKIVLIVVCIILFSSCDNVNVKENYLLYQDFPLEIDAVMTFEGNRYDIYMTVTGIGEGTLIYKTPLTLTGYRYDVANGEVTVSYERLIMKLTDGSFHPAKTAVNLFTLLPEEMISAKLEDHNGIKLNLIQYENNNGIIKVWCTPENIPVRIESDILSLDITNFKGNIE